MKKSPNVKKTAADHSAGARLSGLADRWRRYEPWVPWSIALLYLAVMGVLTLRFHPVGGLEVETDFYAELVPQAKHLLAGTVRPADYGAKGPVYSILLASSYLVIREWFLAGIAINLLAAAGSLAVAYLLVRRVFNGTAALLVAIAIAFNPVFQSMTWQVGSDMPFFLFCALAMYLAFDPARTRRSLALSALFASLAFLTRYNGAFLAAGTVAFLALTGGGRRRRAVDIALWLAVFVLSGLPWYIPNAIATGNPVHNDNAVTVAMEYYAVGRPGFSYETWTDLLPPDLRRKMEAGPGSPDFGLMDVIRADPVHFIAHLALNAARYLLAHMDKLLGWRLGVFAVAGIVGLRFTRPGRRRLLFFLYGVFLFFILTLVFFNVRFSLFLLVFYLPLAVWPWTERPLSGTKIGRAVLVALVITIGSYAVTTPPATLADMRRDIPFLTGLRDLGLALGEIAGDPDAKLAARKPHVAFYAGMQPVMFPPVETPADLERYCREQKVEYVLYGGVELRYRPQLQVLADPRTAPPGFQYVTGNRVGVVYRVPASAE